MIDGFLWAIDGPVWAIDGLLWAIDGRMWAIDGRDKTGDKSQGDRSLAASGFLSWTTDGFLWAIDGHDKIHDKIGERRGALRREFCRGRSTGFVVGDRRATRQNSRAFGAATARRGRRRGAGKQPFSKGPTRLPDKLARPPFETSGRDKNPFRPRADSLVGPRAAPRPDCDRGLSGLLFRARAGSEKINGLFRQERDPAF